MSGEVEQPENRWVKKIKGSIEAKEVFIIDTKTDKPEPTTPGARSTIAVEIIGTSPVKPEPTTPGSTAKTPPKGVKIIYVPFSLSTGLANLDDIRDRLFVPGNFVLLIVYTILGGLFIGAGLLPFRRGLKLGDAWERVASTLYAIKGGWAIVYTDTGL